MVPQSRNDKEGEAEEVRFHNPWLEPRGEPLARLADTIFAEIEAAALRKSGRKPRCDAAGRRRLAVGNIVASLAEIALQAGYEPSVAIDARKHAKTRYDRSGFHRDVLMAAIAAMEAAGFVNVTPGEFRVRRTTLRPTLGLLERFRTEGITSADIGIRPGGEPIVLKAVVEGRNKKELVDYDETSQTIQLREEVEAITETVNRADLRYDGFRTAPVFIKRIFQIDHRDAPQEFNRHGRLWGCWWQNLKKEQRGLITIDGEPICDLDFSACFLNLAYVRFGASLPLGDPYEIDGLDDEYRPALKQAFAALLFRHGTKNARLPDEIRKALPREWTMPKLLAAFSVKHPAIALAFGSGIGLEIMHTESEILVAALLDLAHQGVPALGMHDGLALAVDKKEAGFAAMRNASRSIVGVELPVVEKEIAHPQLTRP